MQKSNVKENTKINDSISITDAINYNNSVITQTNKISENELGTIGYCNELNEEYNGIKPQNRTRAYVSSALSENTVTEYPYIYQPNDETDENGNPIIFKNFSELHNVLPIHKAVKRSQIDEVLDLPIETHSLVVPKNSLKNPNGTVAESIRNVIEELMLLEENIPIIKEQPQPYNY